ncbi:hypothetical protein IEQ34_006115 [Dendrobium chrysotoxum]|uniref:Uncharacterized protein n=1 Tax=Dendrobium chrysotoxum TaxID=161865 RepID=A0AAV7HBZ6_DENCH|nr:hypothetical protein IEQ34_006115 [Dendrobium chrysotoxum]
MNKLTHITTELDATIGSRQRLLGGFLDSIIDQVLEERMWPKLQVGGDTMGSFEFLNSSFNFILMH